MTVKKVEFCYFMLKQEVSLASWQRAIDTPSMPSSLHTINEGGP